MWYWQRAVTLFGWEGNHGPSEQQWLTAGFMTKATAG